MDHRNLHNHQLVMTADQTLSGGKYSVFIVPDADAVSHPVDTGLVLDMTGASSAIVKFTGVIRGLVLLATEIVPEATARISSVLSSYSRYRATHDRDTKRLDYVSSDLINKSSGFTTLSIGAPNHTNMVYHQLALTSDAAIEDRYDLHIIPDSNGVSLETTVDTGITIDFASSTSALVRFGGIIEGVRLVANGDVTSGTVISGVMSSSVERFDEIVYDYIGVAPELGDHITDFGNPHQTSWNNLLGKPDAFLDRYVLQNHLVIPDQHQLLIWESFEIDGGTLEVQPGGRFVVLHDRPEARATEPDFTYNGSGQLTQIDYAAGEQKLFSYDGGGNLTQVDSIRLGTTLRKAFTYTGGGDLDYITETWL